MVGYKRNRTARALRTDRSELIGLVWHGPTNPSVDAIGERMEEIAEERNYGVIHLPYRDARSGQRVLDLLRSGLVDGVVMMGTHTFSAAALRSLAESGVAVVTHSETLRPRGFDVVRHDERRAAAEAIDHLVEQGRTRIRILIPSPDVAGSGPRLNGAMEALAAHGLHTTPVVTGHLREQMYDQARSLLTADRPDAVFGLTDPRAIAVVWAAQGLGLSVPDDVAVVGMGNTEQSEAMSPALSTVGDPHRDRELAALRLFERIHTPGMHGSTLHRPWHLIVRSTSLVEHA